MEIPYSFISMISMLKTGGGKALAVLIAEFLSHVEKTPNAPTTIWRQEHQLNREQLNKYDFVILSNKNIT